MATSHVKYRPNNCDDLVKRPLRTSMPGARQFPAGVHLSDPLDQIPSKGDATV
ncbi:MAG: hypothetical protein U1E21_01125 [Reyranellaceae bacterium]